MVAHRFVESILAQTSAPMEITVIGEESRAPYDRVGLTSYFAGVSPEDLALPTGVFDDSRVTLVTGDQVTSIERKSRTVSTAARRSYAYDTLVLATGSYAARVAVDGADLQG